MEVKITFNGGNTGCFSVSVFIASGNSHSNPATIGSKQHMRETILLLSKMLRTFWISLLRGEFHVEVGKKIKDVESWPKCPSYKPVTVKGLIVWWTKNPRPLQLSFTVNNIWISWSKITACRQIFVLSINIYRWYSMWTSVNIVTPDKRYLRCLSSETSVPRLVHEGLSDIKDDVWTFVN